MPNESHHHTASNWKQQINWLEPEQIIVLLKSIGVQANPDDTISDLRDHLRQEVQAGNLARRNLPDGNSTGKHVLDLRSGEFLSL